MYCDRKHLLPASRGVCGSDASEIDEAVLKRTPWVVTGLLVVPPL
jgi:hypothetical protein